MGEVREVLAVRWHGQRDVRVDDVPAPPAPVPGEVQVRVSWCGICGTDIEEYRNGPIFIPTSTPNPLTGRSAPLTLGHEFAGEVVAVGDGVETLHVGQRIACDTLVFCGTCYWCRRHQVTLCDRLAAFGLMADGGLAELCNVPASTCIPLPESISDEAGALAETLAVTVRALRRGRLAVGEDVAIMGAGAVGLMALQAALASGARMVHAVEPRPERRGLAASLGAATTSETVADDLNVDLAIECSGNAEAIAAALRGTRKGGRVVLVGIYGHPKSINFLDVVATEKELIGSFSHVYDEDFAAALALLGRGTVRAEPIISDRVPLGQAVEHGLDALLSEPAAHLKILVACTAQIPARAATDTTGPDR